ncbi:hypothetical protein FSPOR_7444 [Fusarium sporotrichioides]|uniref:Uncharacterized protein n=1 Tax=Fusarium sporotrichioides TaxID=5514 RepID=A0A395RYE2_FUSSP|nr:hypothetical protein FSPOR_7444 [Fusarium sporotrichioides]
MGFDWLFKSVKQRGTTWRSENFEKPEHRCIKEFFLLKDAKIEGNAESTEEARIRESSKGLSLPQMLAHPHIQPAANGKRKAGTNATIENFCIRRSKRVKSSDEE